MKCLRCKSELIRIWRTKGSYYCPKCNPEYEEIIRIKKERSKALRELNKII